ncbi:MAG TPA: flagellar motor switch protein FliG [Burkholderiales bacterium]|nr:flagellar motor switch protein FliG [Burkholderiales bacterium]
MASEDGVTRSAILLMSIGEEEAVEVFKHLGPKEVQKLGQAMAKLTNVSREEVADVLREFRQTAGQQTSIGTAADQYLRSVLTRALGNEKAGPLIDRILQGQDVSGIESLKWMDSDSIAELIKNEHPQIIATILVHLDPDQAAEVLSKFNERLRNDAMLRIATLEGVQPAALRDLNEVLMQLLAGTDKLKKSARGGIDAAADILNYLGATFEAAVTAHIRETDADLAQHIQDKMFVFDNLVDLDDRSIQLLLREVQSDSLIVALKGTSEALREKIFKNMSQRAAEMLRDDLEAKGPVRLSEVESEQREILRVVRRLAEEGQIVLGGRGDEGLVE